MEKQVWSLQSIGPWGPPPGPHGGHLHHMTTFESPAPEDDSCQVWLQSNHAFLQAVDEQLLSI